MKVPADKPPDNQRQAAAHEAPQQQDRSDAEVQFIDNRAETTSLRQLQEVADNSPRRNGLVQLNAMMNNSPRSGAIQSLQTMVDNSSRRALMGSQAGTDDVTVQRVEDEEVSQGKFIAESQAQLAKSSKVKPNNTGLPDKLKAGVESLSGISLDNVKVHYNSSEPAQLNAHAYAQGTDIHVAPGQEQHLPHEAWHVVQQAQRRLRPTMQMKDGVGINDDVGLESEADLMGSKAVQMHCAVGSEVELPVHSRRLDSIIQRHHMYGKAKLTDGTQDASEIYRVIEKVSGDVVYVGQTCNQVGYVSRFDQHLKSGYHPGWSHGTHRVERIEAGNWTLLETFISEQYWIDNYGFDNLENAANALTLEKFNQYRDDDVTTPTLKGEFRPQQ